MKADSVIMKTSVPTSKIDRLIHEPSRFNIMAHLHAVESADFLFLMSQTGMTWGNLSVHLTKLENAGYVDINKEFIGKKPHTVLRLNNNGRIAFDAYRKNMKQVLNQLPKEKESKKKVEK